MAGRTELNDRIDAWIDSHRDEMIEDLKMLIRIPSIKGEATEGMPFGAACAEAVGTMQGLMEKYGFETTNYENYCIAGDMYGQGEKALDILAHLDVVPVSEDWKKTSPFEPLIEGGRIYGRGAQDDKGPAVASLYAMRCIRELGIGLKKGVRLLCGSDEECGSSDLEYYYSKEEEAEYTFSPDADYPLINVEKGRLARPFRAGGQLHHPIEKKSAVDKDEAVKRPGVRVLGIDVGETPNVIPGKGTVSLCGVSKEDLIFAANQMKEMAVCSFCWEGNEREMTVYVEGTTGHAAFLENAVNCATLILAFLRFLPLAKDNGEDMLIRMADLWPYGEYNGAALGVDYSDKESGELTMSLDVLKYKVSEDGTRFSISGLFDARAPICCNDENLTKVVKRRLLEAGFEMESGEMTPAHYVSADSELVQRLLESYELYFDKKGEALVTGGGTYVHNLKRGVAFGCEVPGIDNRIHGDDEFAEIDVLIKSAKIFADAIVRLCG